MKYDQLAIIDFLYYINFILHIFLVFNFALKRVSYPFIAF